MRNEIIQSAKRLRAKSLANEVNNMHVEQTDGYAAADPGHVGLDHADVGVLRRPNHHWLVFRPYSKEGSVSKNTLFNTNTLKFVHSTDKGFLSM